MNTKIYHKATPFSPLLQPPIYPIHHHFLPRSNKSPNQCNYLCPGLKLVALKLVALV